MAQARYTYTCIVHISVPVHTSEEYFAKYTGLCRRYT